jgi:hypothetical protein
LCLQWKDYSINWIKLKYVKNAYPIDVVKSATVNKIHEDPAFARWDPFNTKGENRFTSREKTRTGSKLTIMALQCQKVLSLSLFHFHQSPILQWSQGG